MKEKRIILKLCIKIFFANNSHTWLFFNITCMVLLHVYIFSKWDETTEGITVGMGDLALSVSKCLFLVIATFNYHFSDNNYCTELYECSYQLAIPQQWHTWIKKLYYSTGTAKPQINVLLLVLQFLTHTDW